MAVALQRNGLSAETGAMETTVEKMEVGKSLNGSKVLNSHNVSHTLNSLLNSISRHLYGIRR